MVIETGNSKTLIVIIGPTAVGKTTVAIEIARLLNTEIISADSRQFYKELNIGVASPSLLELSQAKHHFIGNLSITENYNVSRYETEALKCLDTIFENQNKAILVGGSGLYIDSVCKGIDDLPDPEEELRMEIKELFTNNGIDALRAQLKILDPEYYNQVDLANPKRIMRALEVCLTTGKPYSSLRVNQQKPRHFNIVKIGIHRQREKLYEIINQRVDLMIENGLLEEAKELYPYKELNSLNTVGYKELFAYFDKELTLEEAITKIKVNSRRYAKRQLTWFRKDENIHWFNADEKDLIYSFITENS
jgi:tRNA dimethylallyltransferase